MIDYPDDIILVDLSSTPVKGFEDGLARKWASSFLDRRGTLKRR